MKTKFSHYLLEKKNEFIKAYFLFAIPRYKTELVSNNR